jgi:deazaflavin-dependent oxidoreductase (nitroreductase family)
MPLSGDYVPSPRDFPREQVEQYERSNGKEGGTRNGYPVIIVTSVGAKSGAIRKTPLIRVEHNGDYAAVASIGGAPTNPAWYFNLLSNPKVELQDGAVKRDYSARQLAGAELEEWWERSMAIFPPYGEYRRTSTRTIPILLLSPLDDRGDSTVENASDRDDRLAGN